MELEGGTQDRAVLVIKRCKEGLSCPTTPLRAVQREWRQSLRLPGGRERGRKRTGAAINLLKMKGSDQNGGGKIYQEWVGCQKQLVPPKRGPAGQKWQETGRKKSRSTGEGSQRVVGHIGTLTSISQPYASNTSGLAGEIQGAAGRQNIRPGHANEKRVLPEAEARAVPGGQRPLFRGKSREEEWVVMVRREDGGERCRLRGKPTSQAQRRARTQSGQGASSVQDLDSSQTFRRGTRQIAYRPAQPGEGEL